MKSEELYKCHHCNATDSDEDMEAGEWGYICNNCGGETMVLIKDKQKDSNEKKRNNG